MACLIGALDADGEPLDDGEPEPSLLAESPWPGTLGRCATMRIGGDVRVGADSEGGAGAKKLPKPALSAGGGPMGRTIDPDGSLGCRGKEPCSSELFWAEAGVATSKLQSMKKINRWFIAGPSVLA